MKSNATKSTNRKAAFQAAGCRWNLMKRSVLKIGLLAALSALSASSARANFSTGNYYGNTWISNSATLNNSGSMTYNISTAVGNTNWNYWGMGVLDKGADGATINNNSGGTMQSILSGARRVCRRNIFAAGGHHQQFGLD